MWPAIAARVRASAGTVIVAPDPLVVLQEAGRRSLARSGATVVAITGSVGKTTTKDILVAMLRAAGVRVHGTAGNRNTEVGVPLSMLDLPEDAEVAVVEMGMRGTGQIAARARRAAPCRLHHLDRARAPRAARSHWRPSRRPRWSSSRARADGDIAVVPADEPLLDRHVHRHRGRVVTFGAEDADVHIVAQERRGRARTWLLDAFGHRARMDFSFTGGHYLHDALAAVAAFVELGYRLDEAAEGAGQVAFSDLRGALPSFPAGGCCSTTPTTPTPSP